MLLISVENSYLLLCRFIWKKSCTNWLTLSVLSIDLFLTYVFICKHWKKEAKQQVFKNLFTEISVSTISFWSLFQWFFFFQDFPEPFPWILSDNIFFVSKISFKSSRDGQPGSLQTQSLTCKKRDWFPVIIQTLVSL